MDHITDADIKLHWLPIRMWIQYKQGRRKVMKSEETQGSKAQRAEARGPKSQSENGVLGEGQLSPSSPVGAV